MREMIQQLATLAPALIAQMKGDPVALEEFTRGYQSTLAQMEEKKLRQQQMAMQGEDRQLALADREREIARLAEQDRIAQGERDYRKSQDAIEMLSKFVPAQETMGGAETMSQSIMARVPEHLREGVAGIADQQLREQPQMITDRQRKQAEEFLEKWEKSPRKPEFDDAAVTAEQIMIPLPDHLAGYLGKPQASLAEVQKFARLPVGKPASTRAKPNPTEASLALEAAGGDAAKAFGMLNPPKGDSEPLMQVSEIDPQTGEMVTSLVPRRPGEVSRKSRPTTESERKAAAFYRQMEGAIKTLDELETTLTEAELYQIQTLPQEALIGLANRGKMSENAKRYLRAFEQFTEARLRPVSGAAIADSEFARDRRTYARQYAETPQLNADRRAARRLALESLGDMAGAARPAAKPVGGAETPKIKIGDTVRDKKTGALSEVTAIRPDGSLVLRPKA